MSLKIDALSISIEFFDNTLPVACFVRGIENLVKPFCVWPDKSPDFRKLAIGSPDKV